MQLYIGTIEIYYKRNISSQNMQSNSTLKSKFNIKYSSLCLILSMLILVGHAEKIPAQDIAINPEGTAPWLVVAVSDNGQTSTMANAEYGTNDDRTFIYLTNDSVFKDNTL